MASKNTVCLWYDGTALDAATFYAETFPDSRVDAVHHAPGDYPDGKQGDVLTVEFTVMGIPCLGLNGGDAFRHDEAFSFQVATDDQAETDRLWNTIDGDAQDRYRRDQGRPARLKLSNGARLPRRDQGKCTWPLFPWPLSRIFSISLQAPQTKP